MYELYDFNNKISIKRCDEIYKMLNIFYNGSDKFEKDDKYDRWLKMITTDENYSILLYTIDDEVVGFISYTYINEGLMLSEIQIKDEYQGKRNILKSMLKEVCKNCDLLKSKIILVTIKEDNDKSKAVFTHIGFKKENGIKYKIRFNDLIKWIETK